MLYIETVCADSRLTFTIFFRSLRSVTWTYSVDHETFLFNSLYNLNPSNLITLPIIFFR